ncbi:MAG: VRR-NUC domain-containing protein [Verrucomicrobiota bacterium]
MATHEARNAPAVRSGVAADAPEREIEGLHRPIIEECKRRGWKYVHSDPTRPSTCGEGVCDFIIYADGGRMFHVECKARKGKLSLEQMAFIHWIEKLGHKCHVVTGMSEFMEIVK